MLDSHMNDFRTNITFTRHFSDAQMQIQTNFSVK